MRAARRVKSASASPMPGAKPTKLSFVRKPIAVTAPIAIASRGVSPRRKARAST